MRFSCGVSFGFGSLWSRGQAGGGHGSLHRLVDLHVAGATAQIARQGLAHLQAGRVGDAIEKLPGRDQDAWSAVATLGGAKIGEGLLQGMQAAVLHQTFDGQHLAAVAFQAQDQAGEDRLPIQEYGAGAALAQFTPMLGAGEMGILPQQFQQGLVGSEGDLGLLSIQVQRDVSVLHVTSPGLPSPASPWVGSAVRPPMR